MTRDEAEKLLANLGVKHEIAVRLASLSTEINVDVLADLLHLARLGLRVECPSEADVEAAAWALGQLQFDNPAEVDYCEWTDLPPSIQERLKAEARAALAALKGEGRS